MARPQENPPPVFTSTAPYSPITERENEGAEEYAGGGCDCFRRFCFGGSRSSLLRERGTGGGSPWLVEKLKKLKELSEMVAGPKWKNFVRRIGKFCSPKKHVNSTQQNAQFKYSPESYALNFSGGDNSEDHGGGEEEEGNLLHSFSSRFARAEQSAVADTEQSAVADTAVPVPLPRRGSVAAPSRPEQIFFN